MKKCPVCKVELNQMTLEADLPAYGCSQCQGLWLSANEYLAWLQVQPAQSAETIAPDMPLPSFDTTKAILCPDCGHILRRYKIWPEIEFHLDRCGNCNGIWFDQNEWQVLKARHLHHQVNLFFTEAWQQKLRTAETRQRFEKMYLDRFGADDYTEIKRIRAWLSAHPHRPGLMAYLADDDPYKG
ncbi:MAG: zf-TFIIB domain-containing protein [Anaerolineae bacterium]